VREAPHAGPGPDAGDTEARGEGKDGAAWAGAGDVEGNGRHGVNGVGAEGRSCVVVSYVVWERERK